MQDRTGRRDECQIGTFLGVPDVNCILHTLLRLLQAVMHKRKCMEWKLDVEACSTRA